MDPVTTTGLVAGGLAAYAGQRAVDAAVDGAIGSFLQTCIDWRARAYFSKLAAILSNVADEDLEPGHVSAILGTIVRSSSARERVYEYFRIAFLSRSRELGPRIIALIAAKLIAEDRVPSPEEQRFVEAAEFCIDEDLLAFSEHYENLSKKRDDWIVHRNDGIRARIASVTHGSSSLTSTSEDPSPLNLSAQLAPWASKLERAGLIQQFNEIKRVQVPSERTGKLESKIEMEHSVQFGEEARKFADLVRLARPVENSRAAKS